jgi:hypothetical protein
MSRIISTKELLPNKEVESQSLSQLAKIQITTFLDGQMTTRKKKVKNFHPWIQDFLA